MILNELYKGHQIWEKDPDDVKYIIAVHLRDLNQDK